MAPPQSPRRVLAVLLAMVLALATLVSLPLAARAEPTTVTGAVNASGQAWRTHDLVAPGDGTLAATLTWESGDADLHLFARRIDDPGASVVGPMVAHSKTGAAGERLSFEAEAGQAYRLYVQAQTGASDYSLVTDLTTDPQRRHVGTVELGTQTYRAHAFTLTEPALVAGALDWAGSADLGLYLRTAGGTTLDLVRTSAVPERLTADLPAGQYEWLVRAESGAGAYELVSDVRPTGPLADGDEVTFSAQAGHVPAGGGRQVYESHDVTVAEDGELRVSLEALESANLDLFVSEVTGGTAGPILVSSATGTSPEQVSLPVADGERYRLTVKATSGAAGYDLSAGLVAGPGRAIIGTSDPASQNWRTYPVPVTEPGLLTAELDWVGAENADLALYLRSPQGTLLELSKTDARPERFTRAITAPGTYQVVVNSTGGAAAFDLDVAHQTGAERTWPGLVGFTATGGGIQSYDSFDWVAPATGVATADLAWDAGAGANLNLFVREVTDPQAPDAGPLLASSTTSVRPEQLSFAVEEGSTYRLYTHAGSGRAHFDLSARVGTDPDALDFLGTADAGTSQHTRAHAVTASAPGTLAADLTWAGTADLTLALLDEDDAVIDSIDGSSSPLALEADVAAGAYTWLVTAEDGAAAYTLASAFTEGAAPSTGCAPLSVLNCADLTPTLPVALAFDGTDGGLEDGSGVGTGFTVADPPSDRLPADGATSFPEVPGYEPGRLAVADGVLELDAAQGIAYGRPPRAQANSQINTLGIPALATEGLVVTTTVIPGFDTSDDYEKGGLWFGLDEDDHVNLALQNQPGGNIRVQLQREVGGTVTPATDVVSSAAFPQGGEVELVLTLDAESRRALGSYRSAGGEPIALGSVPLPASFFDGVALPESEGPDVAFAGVFATARNEADTPFVLGFADFGVQVPGTVPDDNTAPEVLLTGDRTLVEGQEIRIPVGTFDEDDDDVAVTVDGLPTGLTYADGSIAGTLGEGTAREEAYRVAVTGDDGTDSTTETFQIEVTEAIDLAINFQPATMTPPAGYLADTGAPFGARAGGLTYGWVEQGSDTPLDLSKNVRLRTRAGVSPLQNSMIHLQYGDIADVFGGNADCTANECEPGAWQIEVPNGLYEVTVSVGDQPGTTTYDSHHAVNVGPGVAIRDFRASAAQEYLEATATAGVTDGVLRVDAIGGANTKLNSIEIRSLGTQPFVQTSLPENRAVDADLDTAVSASVRVPGSGLGVNPSRETSLTDEAIRLFELTPTGEVEITGNRGSTGGNDTISFSPAEPLKPETTYRYVIDGVLDEAGNTFGRHQSVFTTGEGEGGPVDEEFDPVSGVSFEKVLIPTASGTANGKYFASLVVHDGYLWATTIGQGLYRYEILPDGDLGPAEDLDLLKGRAAVGLVFDRDDPDLAWVTHATANLNNEGARTGSTVSVIDFSDVADPEVTDVFVHLPRAMKDHLSNSLTYGPSGDGEDGAPWLYFPQGSNQAAGDVDGGWGDRGETELTAALLRFDPVQALATARADGPVDVKTAAVGGSYDPFAEDAPLQVYATGIRNAYDVLWHSNGSLYVPTNGTAGGGNSPGVTIAADGSATMTSTQDPAQNGYGDGTDVTDQCAVRADGEPYTGGSVPALANHPTQRDFLYEVEEDGYYGHPNPTRCEWALNNAGLTAGAGQGGSKYPSTVQPDPNYRGWAYDFDFNKSPNGVMEYTSDTFGGALQGRMMVIRFSANDDLLTLQVADDGTVLGAQPGTDIPGFTGFVDPLDVVEDTEVNPGNLYVNQYNRGGQPQQLYLLRVPEGEAGGGIEVDTQTSIHSATLNAQQATDTRPVTVTNRGDEPVTVTATVTGTHAAQWATPAPFTVAAGATSTVSLTFDPSGTPGVRTASVALATESGPTRQVALRGLAFAGQQGNNEPTFQLVADALDLGIDVGWTNLAGGMQPVAKGDEVLEPLFERASDGPVTLTPVAAFAPQENLPFGWYPADSTPADLNEVGAIATGQLQKLNPATTAGSESSFDPGAEAFGVYYYSNTFQRTGYTEDARNDGGKHRARVYPLGGTRYLVAFEDADNGDYQDYVFVLDNVTPADAGSEPGDPDTVRVNFQAETGPVPQGYLRDFGQAYGARSSADQGEGHSYGWITPATGAPKSIVGNGRSRTVSIEPRLASLMHMDLPAASPGVAGTSAWELAVPDGTYEVTVAVGDPTSGGDPESHTVVAEGVPVIEGFPKSTAPNGSPDRHRTATSVVAVSDGRLTLTQAGGTNTKINYVDVVPTDEPAPGIEVVGQVSFRPATSAAPSGWTADNGALFTEARGFGWVRTAGEAAKSADTRVRASESNPLDAGFVIVDNATVAAVVNGEWEYALPDGRYRVEASVGDKDHADSVHGLSAEGATLVDDVVPPAPGAYHVGSVDVEVLDGALTLANTGTNTKLQWVRISDIAELPDTIAPRVSVELTGQGEDAVYAGPVQVEVTATDHILEFVEYRVDGGPLTGYTTPFTVTAPGDHVVEVIATDGAGNVTEETVEFTIVATTNGRLTLTNPEAAPFHDRLVMSRIQNPTSSPVTNTTARVVLGNNGSAPITVSALTIEDPDAFTLVNPPTLPATIGVGQQVTLTVQFTGTGTGRFTVMESVLRVRHNATNGPSQRIDLGAVWQVQSEGGNEPNIDDIAEVFGYGTTILGPGQQINNQGRLEKIGDEVHSRTWRRANTSQPVSVRQLAAYHTCCNNTATFGWHPVGNKNAWTRVLTHNGQWAQSLLPRRQGSSTEPAVSTFTPGPATFSLRSDPESSDWLLNDTGPDQCGPNNAGCQLGHHMRFWPVKDDEGEVVPNAYLVGMDYSGINYDFQDNIYLVTNLTPAD